MGKVILLSRVSSEHQDLSQQTDKVLDEIKKDGYKDTMKQAEEDIARLNYDKENSETKIDYDKLDIKRRIELIRKCIKKIIIERQTRFIVKLEIQMRWKSIWDMTINTRERKVLDVNERFLGNLLPPPK